MHPKCVTLLGMLPFSFFLHAVVAVIMLELKMFNFQCSNMTALTGDSGDQVYKANNVLPVKI